MPSVFCYYLVQYPHGVLFVWKIISKFVMLYGILLPRSGHFRKCFRGPSKRMWKFSVQEDKRTALISCVVMWLCTFVRIPNTIQVWGYCIVYSCTGHSTTFFDVNESQLHTFFVYINHYRGADSNRI